MNLPPAHAHDLASQTVEPCVQDHVNRALRLFTGLCAQRFIDYIQKHPQTLPGPFEQCFWIWWKHLRDCGQVANDIDLVGQHPVTGPNGADLLLDFQLRPAPCPRESFPRFAIELDGHDVHERTREQVTARNQRDRYLDKHGWHVWHFSWTEFERDPAFCVQQSVSRASELFSEWRLRLEITRL
jgi:hypothetical protein